jgi:hypothetical protein
MPQPHLLVFTTDVSFKMRYRTAVYLKRHWKYK